METFACYIGITGVLLQLLAYYLLNFKKMSSDSVRYQLYNLFGATFILLSLKYQWNIASFLIEVAWLSISMVRIGNWFRKQVCVDKIL